MTLYARCEKGSVLELRDFEAPPPEHKIHLWKIVEEVGAGPVSEWVIEGDVARRIRSQRPVTAAMIKAEAQRRIIALVGASDLQSCLIKQLNALMRATELARKEASNGGLSEAEAKEATLLQGLADRIKSIRSLSNDLEISLPADYTEDARWQVQ